ncbi:MAG: hypothetical protein HFH39_02865 [Lachnospiraceae bacterium]|nr:hypothetical protein [Lachnospiraceae bacterium]
MEEKLNLILSKLGSLETDMQGMKADMQGMKADMTDMKADMQGMKADMTDMKADMQGMKDDIKRLDAKVAKIELTLENEIRVNIQRIAEGHLDLSHILHDAMKPNAEVEMLAIKVRKLESEVRDIKFRLA